MDTQTSKDKIRSLIDFSVKRRAELTKRKDLAKRIEDSTVIKKDYSSKKLSEVTDKNTQRKKQLKIGKITLSYIEEFNKDFEESLEIKERAKKSDAEKVKPISIKLSPVYLRKLSKIKKYKGYKYKQFGLSRKIQYLLKFHERESERIEDQLKILKAVVGEFDNKLQDYLKKYNRAEKFVENELSLTDLLSLSNRINTIMKIQCVSVGDLSKYLDEKDIKSIEFSKSWGARIQKELSI